MRKGSTAPRNWVVTYTTVDGKERRAAFSGPKRAEDEAMYLRTLNLVLVPETVKVQHRSELGKVA